MADHIHEATTTATRRPAFREDEFRARLARVQDRIRALELDGLLIHTPENLCYLTGYETTGYFEYQVLAVPAEGDPELLIRNVERHNVDEYSWLPGARLWRDGTDFLAATRELVADVVDGPRIGVEAHSWFLPHATYRGLEAAMPGHALADAGRLVETIRLVKSPAELEHVREAARLADVAMEAAIGAARAGASELEVAAAAHAAQIRAGGEYPALPHYIASGYRCELGHPHWTGKRLAEGELLKLEFLGCKRRYHAGLTRPVAIGRPSEGERRDAELCLTVQAQTLEAIRPGVMAAEIDRAARGALVAAGRADDRIRSGYSMGIGFPPIAGEGQTCDFRAGAEWVLEPGMVFHMLTVMRVGLVLSDTIVVTDDGCERLTRSTRELVSV